MKVALAAMTVAALLVVAQAATAASTSATCTAPPAPGGATRSVQEGHAKASSFAPGHSRRRSYGAPIPKPIVARHGKAKKKPAPRPLKAASS
jgi:hypothetical protein